MPDDRARARSERLVARILDEAGQCGGIPFDRFMEQALYAPGLGYYAAPNRKFGADGDFVTAPEVSSLFARCIANQCAEILDRTGGGDLLEFGAGSGALAADLLQALADLGARPRRYLILEVSGELRERQRARLNTLPAELAGRVAWLDRLPAPGFRGVVIANEVLDAMPVNRFRVGQGRLEEQFVGAARGCLELEWRPAANPALREAVSAIEAALGPFEAGFESEVNLRLAPWIAQLSALLEAGAVLLIDYGHTRREYYHPLRREGTLMCHYRHRAHADPLHLPGLQDITAHVDFTAAAEAAQAAGLNVAGYTSQAFFLMATGLDRLVAEAGAGDATDRLGLVQEVKQLTLPGGMGERFKVLGLTRGLPLPLLGFGLHDQTHRL